jgi:hypothetical protein
VANPVIETFDRRGMTLKLEVTEGLDSAPTQILNSFQILDGKSKLEADSIDRKLDRPHWNSARKKAVNFRASIEGSVEIVPMATPGVTPASIDTLLQIAGFARTYTVPDPVGPPIVIGRTTYNPIAVAIPSATGYFWHAGTYRKLLGSRANMTGISMEIGKYLMAQIRIEGGCIDIEEAALPTDFDFSAFTDPTDASTESMELLINGFAVNGLMLSVDLGNDLKTKQHTEARRARISTRQSTFKARFYRTLKADFDPIAKWKTGEIIQLLGTTEEPDGRLTQLPVLGEISGVEEVDEDGEYAWEISGNCVATDAGNDELLIDFAESA